jgi:chlorite dismutase
VDGSRPLSHYALVRFTTDYWALPPDEKLHVHESWLAGLRRTGSAVQLYQVFPTEQAADLCVWSWIGNGADEAAAAAFFAAFTRATSPVRRYVQLTCALWGYARPSQYSRAPRSAQAIDPASVQRRRYLVIYPFVKTTEWYLKPADERQAMMTEHIRIGKQYTDVSQLLLYSFGLQDQEFVVVYEMDSLHRFSELVAELRATESRRFTLRDTPLHTCVWQPAEQTLALFR